MVNLKAGTYRVDKTITFDDRDSGATYRSVDGPGKAVFEGSTEVTGWTPYKDGIFKAPVDVDQPFYTLYAEGKRATTARYPNRRVGRRVGAVPAVHPVRPDQGSCPGPDRVQRR